MRSHSRLHRWLLRLTFVAMTGLAGAPVLSHGLHRAAAGPLGAAVCSAAQSAPAEPEAAAAPCATGLPCCGVLPLGLPAAAIAIAPPAPLAAVLRWTAAPLPQASRARPQARAPPG